MNARRLALVVLLAALGPAACSASPELTRVRIPREGVSLRYALPQGQGFEGRLRVGNTRAIDGLEAPLSQTATCDISMVVIGPAPEGIELRATITSIDLDWDLPPAATYSPDELIELANQRLRGMQVRLVVRDDGRIQSLPAVPAGTPIELAEVIETLLHGLEAFFIPLPPEPLGRRHDEWSESFSHTTTSGLTYALEHHLRLDAGYRHRTDGSTLLRLEFEQDRRAQRPGELAPVTVEREARGVMLFDAEGFPAELDRETREFDPEQGMVFRKVRAQWSRVRGMVPELIVPTGGDIQVIEDPCNPDYVGPKPCEEPLTPPEAQDPEPADPATEDEGEDEAAEDEDEPDEGDGEDEGEPDDEGEDETEPEDADEPDEDD